MPLPAEYATLVDVTFRPGTVEAAVFDIGGVFTYPDYEPVAAKLDEIGVEPPHDIGEYRRAHHAGVLAMAVSGHPPEEYQADFWSFYDEAYAVTLGVGLEQLDDFRVAMRVGWSWVHRENVAAFHRLAATGFPVAIVSNNNGTAPEQMRDYGVCQVGEGPLPSVAAIVDSTLAGVAKPDPAIFEPALAALGQLPDRVLYVGDTVHADVAGATNAGMQVVQLDPYDHHADFDHARMENLDVIVEILIR
ncbi:MAG: HAD-IA family hydrolase [Acidimicrobiales bacterium]